MSAMRAGVLAVAAMVTLGCSAEKQPVLIHEIASSEDFQQRVLEQRGPVLADFYGTWCPPCKILEPRLEALARVFEGKATFVRIDEARLPSLLTQYRITGYPTVIIFVDGQAVSRLEGLHESGDYHAALQAALSKAGKGQAAGNERN